MILKKIHGNHPLNHDKVVSDIFKTPSIVSFINPVSYLVLRKHNSTIKNIDYIYCDGILASLWLSLINFSRYERYSFDFTSLASPFFQYCSENNKKVFFIGAHQNEITNFIKTISNEFKDLKISGFRNGYFVDDELSNILKEIEVSSADVVICGMGCPKQEVFCVEASKVLTNVNVFITCGGFFHQTQQSISYYPVFIDRFNLRMPYRLFKEKHTRKRVLSYPLFLFVALYDGIKLRLSIF
jgi:N-acetylglucosaminyldiphosphoundecaprenol N-acetyl-beta-D-mannosaminyltransferase